MRAEGGSEIAEASGWLCPPRSPQPFVLEGPQPKSKSGPTDRGGPRRPLGEPPRPQTHIEVPWSTRPSRGRTLSRRTLDHPELHAACEFHHLVPRFIE